MRSLKGKIQIKPSHPLDAHHCTNEKKTLDAADNSKGIMIILEAEEVTMSPNPWCYPPAGCGQPAPGVTRVWIKQEICFFGEECSKFCFLVQR